MGKCINIVVLLGLGLLTSCISHQYYPSTYDDSIVSFPLTDQNFTKKHIVVSAYKRFDSRLTWDNDLYVHVASLLERQGAEVRSPEDEVDNEEQGQDAKEKDTPGVQIKLVHEMKWIEKTAWGTLFNVGTYGCYPDEEKMWYETEITAFNGYDIVYQDSFKSLMVEKISWCYYFYSYISSFFTDSKTTEEHIATNSRHFDKFLSQVVHQTIRQNDRVKEVGEP